MTLHNYRLICPNGLFMVKGEICEKCSGGKEFWCFFRNCERSLSKSLGYALRNFVARVRRSYLNNVHVYAALTCFQRNKLVEEGYLAERIEVVPNMVQPVVDIGIDSLGDYIGYVGRVSPEKGVHTLLEAARSQPKIKFQAAGGYEKVLELVRQAPGNFRFLGHLTRHYVDAFMAKSRVIVLCSICYEGFPMVLVEAMLQGRPVIASRIGGISEIIEDNITGLLFEAGNAEDLAGKIQYLWDNPELCRKMGRAGREKALLEYSPAAYHRRLMDVYEKAKEICQNQQ
jgi:glycosyltransferase involved in cell wall biosynthesis